jgi:hypothetical protein
MARIVTISQDVQRSRRIASNDTGSQIGPICSLCWHLESPFTSWQCHQINKALTGPDKLLAVPVAGVSDCLIEVDPWISCNADLCHLVSTISGPTRLHAWTGRQKRHHLLHATAPRLGRDVRTSHLPICIKSRKQAVHTITERVFAKIAIYRASFLLAT